jgi:hypothetical protein
MAMTTACMKVAALRAPHGQHYTALEDCVHRDPHNFHTERFSKSVLTSPSLRALEIVKKNFSLQRTKMEEP